MLRKHWQRTANTGHSASTDSGSIHCDLTQLRSRDIAHGEHVSSQAIVMQQKTKRQEQFEITEQTRTTLEAWIIRTHSINPNRTLEFYFKETPPRRHRH